MEWIKDRAHPQRLLCMTGAAGSGKSALQQSIAECCAKDNILGGAYFISAADPSRNTVLTIVPTIAYQLGSNHPVLQGSVAAAVERDPLIFSRSLEAQMNTLVVRPFESLRESRESDITSFPFAILIDGVDECQGELLTSASLDDSNTVAKHRAEDRQAELLTAIKNSLLKHELPFRILIASRPEWAIHTAHLVLAGWCNNILQPL
jgi:ABC-type dipeptide/oligopeptide/nickel transport system ATPase component